jgi:Protein of unknown function (DUF1566)
VPVHISLDRLRGALAALALPLFACEAPATLTQILVVVDSDLTVGSELTAIQVGVFDRTGSGEALGTRSFQLASEVQSPLTFTLPLSFGIAPSSRSSGRDFKLVVTGRGRPDGLPSETDVVEQKVIAAFVPGQSLRLGVFLARPCYTKLCREEAAGELTCVRGDCVDVPVLTDLPRADSTPLAGYVPPVRVGSDAGSSVDLRDGATDDEPPPPDASPGDGATDPAPPPDSGSDAQVPDASLDAGSPDAGFDAGTCEPGFGPGPNGVCVDIDECSTLSTRCDTLNFPCEQTAAPGFICRGQLADWPMPAAVNGGQSGFNYDVTTSPGTVIDVTTGLQWERTPTVTATYANAVGACEQLILGDFDDWRMPSAVELFSLLDERRIVDANSLAIDSNAFVTVLSSSTNVAYWSSTPDVATPGTRLRRVVDFRDASSSAAFGESSVLPVRCVRRAQPVLSGFPEERFGPDTASTVIDRRTGLIWQRDVGGPFAWVDALTYCASQNALGMPRPFRVPGYKELRTLVDSASPSNNPVFTEALGNFTGRSFWSSSEVGRSATSTSAYYVEFLNGYSGPDLKTKLFFVRCVRSSVD